ncbi:GCN5-related N-acetyl-transferase-domain-containing protein [Phascolomyces articulosus]|uniref:GCN5-related N-acetyl-transferase-domain-containing protein n=1 Tax=Phascolomyces articulosus TaxID=60185 RepID=A0AAD5K511_9FUNG|nr:GCN5-related N-acetyl-transferase-domain-containing protein [Phascolomyces articulosus]
MMGSRATPSLPMTTSNTSAYYGHSSSINQNLKSNVIKMATASLPIATITPSTVTKQQTQQLSRVNNNNRNSAITMGTNTNNGRKRSMDAGTQIEKGSPPTKARIIDSPFATETFDIVHDRQACMFKMKLDGRGSIAALCYLPTRVQTLIEFYHTEIPIGYRDMGLGDQLVKKAFEWAEERKALIIATCPFVRRYLVRHQHGNVVRTEQEAIEWLMK